MRLSLKACQTETLQKLGEYCQAVRVATIAGNRRPERDACEAITGRNYFAPPGFDGVPYLCLRPLPGIGSASLRQPPGSGRISVCRPISIRS